MRPQRSNQMDKRGCFKCGAEDHWHRECPHKEKQPQFKPVPRFCDECMVSHLPLHCPRNPINQPQTSQDKGKAPLNIVQVIPSGTEDETLVPIQVVTRAQAKDNPEIQPQEPEQVPTKKQKHKTWRERKACLVAKKTQGRRGKTTTKKK